MVVNDRTSLNYDNKRQPFKLSFTTIILFGSCSEGLTVFNLLQLIGFMYWQHITSFHCTKREAYLSRITFRLSHSIIKKTNRDFFS